MLQGQTLQGGGMTRISSLRMAGIQENPRAGRDEAKIPRAMRAPRELTRGPRATRGPTGTGENKDENKKEAHRKKAHKKNAIRNRSLSGGRP